MASAAGLCFLFFFLWAFILVVSNTPSRSSYSPANDYARERGPSSSSYSPTYSYTRDRDSYVSERASSYMSDSEYRQAKETLDYLNCKVTPIVKLEKLLTMNWIIKTTFN